MRRSHVVMSGTRGFVSAAVVSLAVLLAGCGVGPLAGPTESTTAAPAPTVAPSVVSACFGTNVPSEDVTQSGDFLVTRLDLGGLTYPSVMLPDGTPTETPLRLTRPGSDAYAADFPESPITNPFLGELGGGFRFAVCNISASAAHALQSVSATVASFTAYAGALNEWQFCNGPTDSHHTFAGGAGCGGGVAVCACFHATFPQHAPVGTQVAMSETYDSLIDPGDHRARLPLTLAPGTSVEIFVGMDVPKPAGQYSFSFTLHFAGGAVATPESPVVLLAPVAHEWSGQACQTAAFLAQITPTEPETYYICPM